VYYTITIDSSGGKESLQSYAWSCISACMETALITKETIDFHKYNNYISKALPYVCFVWKIQHLRRRCLETHIALGFAYSSCCITVFISRHAPSCCIFIRTRSSSYFNVCIKHIAAHSHPHLHAHARTHAHCYILYMHLLHSSKVHLTTSIMLLLLRLHVART